MAKLKYLFALLAFPLFCGIVQTSNGQQIAENPWWSECGPDIKEFIDELEKYKKALSATILTAGLNFESEISSLLEQPEAMKGLVAKTEASTNIFRETLADLSPQTEIKLKKESDELSEATNALKYPPVGYVYVQYHLDKSPTEIYPDATWVNISEDYAGLFFRAEGGGSEAFKSTQTDNTRAVTEIQHMYQRSGDSWKCMDQTDFHCWRPLGAETGFSSVGDWGVRVGFRSSEGEVRPVNAAIRLWRRVR